MNNLRSELNIPTSSSSPSRRPRPNSSNSPNFPSMDELNIPIQTILSSSPSRRPRPNSSNSPNFLSMDELNIPIQTTLSSSPSRKPRPNSSNSPNFPSLNELNIPIQTILSSSPSRRPRPNSSNSPNPPSSPNSRNSPDSDDILNLVNPAFPPNIDPKALGTALFNKRKRSKKMLNEFFIYRKEFVKELKRLNLRPKQTRVSSLASTSWHKQPSEVKDEYRRLARETEKMFMAERQRESRMGTEYNSESLSSAKTDSNESSPDDTTPATSPIYLAPLSPSPEHYQLPLDQQQMPYYTQIVENPMTTYPMHTGDYYWPTTAPTNPYFYYDMSQMPSQSQSQSQQSVQETNFFPNYREQL